jgi:hypothetical protein
MIFSAGIFVYGTMKNENVLQRHTLGVVNY